MLKIALAAMPKTEIDYYYYLKFILNDKYRWSVAVQNSNHFVDKLIEIGSFSKILEKD